MSAGLAVGPAGAPRGRPRVRPRRARGPGCSSGHRRGWRPAPHPSVTYKWIGKIARDICIRLVEQPFIEVSVRRSSQVTSVTHLVSRIVIKELFNLIVGLIFISALGKC